MNMTDEEIIAYWRGAYDRMAARSIEDGAKIAKLEAQNKRLRDALLECDEYFDNRADADCDQDGYIPNEEMKMLTVVREVIEVKP